MEHEDIEGDPIRPEVAAMAKSLEKRADYYRRIGVLRILWYRMFPFGLSLHIAEDKLSITLVSAANELAPMNYFEARAIVTGLVELKAAMQWTLLLWDDDELNARAVDVYLKQKGHELPEYVRHKIVESGIRPATPQVDNLSTTAG